MKKTILPLFLIFLLLCAVGCGRTEGSRKEDFHREPVVINVYDSGSAFRGMQTGWYAGILQENFNVRLNFLDPDSPDSLEKADLLICREKLEDPAELLAGGLLLDLTPYLEEDFLQSYGLSDYEESFSYWNQSLGTEEIYVIPSLVSRLPRTTPSEECLPKYGVCLNWDVYEKIGMPDIENMEDLLPVLAAMLEYEQGTRSQNGRNTSDSAPAGLILALDGDADLFAHISSLIGAQGGRMEGFLIHQKNGYEELLEEDSLYLKTLSWLREAYSLGLLSEMRTNLAEMRTKGKTESVSDLYGKKKSMMSLWPEMQAQGYELVPMEDLRIASDGCEPLGSLDTYVAIGAACKNPERVLEYAGWLYSTEGIMTSATQTDLKSAGPQGLTWEVKDGNPVLTEFARAAFFDVSPEGTALPDGWGDGTWQEGCCHLSLQPVISVEICPSGFSYNYTLWETTLSLYTASSLSWQEKTDALSPMQYLIENNLLEVFSPSHQDFTAYEAWDAYSSEEPKDIADKRSACMKVIAEYSLKMIHAGEAREASGLLDEMRKQLLPLGYNDVVSYDRSILDRSILDRGILDYGIF